jgi:multiple sugar transport system substrate-binding protein
MTTSRIIGVAVAAALLAASGCAARPAEQAVTGQPMTELVWATGGITAPAPQAVADMWNETHPEGPRVRIERMPAQSDDQHRMLALELGAGVPDLDVLDLDVVWTADFAERGWLVDLSDLRPQIEAVSQRAALDSAMWDGKLWAAPYTTDAGLLFYRKDLVAVAPTTWDELVAEGTRVAAGQDIAPYVVEGAPTEGLVCGFLELLWGADGAFTIGDDDAVRLDEGPAGQALEFLRNGVENDTVLPGAGNMDQEEARMAFQSGRAVFLRSWPYAYTHFEVDADSAVAGRVGVAPLPTLTGGPSVAALGGHNLAVSSYSDAPEAAAEFVRYVSTDLEVQRMLATDFSLAPAAAAVYAEPSTSPVLRTLRGVLATARPRPVTPRWSEVSELLQQRIVAVTSGRTSAGEAVGDLRELVGATVESG